MRKLAWILVISFLITICVLPVFAETSTQKEETHEYKKGEAVYFGSYEQDNDPENGKESIEWIVLGTTGNGNVILYSKYILEAKPYNESGSGVKWEDTSLNAWLNSEFKDLAFTEQEKEGISIVRLMQFDELLTTIPVAQYGVDASAYFIANYPDLYDSNKHYVTQWCLGPALFAMNTVKPFVVYGDSAKTDALDGYGEIDALYGIRPEILVNPDAIPVTEHPDNDLFDTDKKGECSVSILPYTDLSAVDWSEPSVPKMNGAFMLVEYALSLSGDDVTNVLLAAINNGATFLKEGNTYIVVSAKDNSESFSLVYRNLEWTMNWYIHNRSAAEVLVEYANAYDYETFTYTGEEMYGPIMYLIENLGGN